MKYRQFIKLITGPDGFLPTPHLRRIIRKNDRPTAREEAIAAKVIEEANPRENISGHYGWDKEETFILQQLWIRPSDEQAEWRDVPISGADYLVSYTEDGMPVPEAVREPAVLEMDLVQRIRELLQ